MAATGSRLAVPNGGGLGRASRPHANPATAAVLRGRFKGLRPRKPKLLFSLFGSLLLRFEACRLLELLFLLPPEHAVRADPNPPAGRSGGLDLGHRAR